jgi:flavodoxin
MEDIMMGNIISIKNKKDCTMFIKNRVLTKSIFLLLTISLLMPWHAFAKENATGETLIIYYSRTGKTKLICETLQKHLNADLLEIKDLKEREGTWGYLTAAFDAILNRHTPIEPEKIDFSPYQAIIVASPVWNWKISTPVHTFFDANKFDGKKVVLITNANIHIMKYEQYGEDASFVKRFLKDYIRGKQKKARSVFMTGSGKYVGHYHLETKEKTDEEIIEETLKFVDDIKHNIASDRIDVAKRIERLHDGKI